MHAQSSSRIPLGCHLAQSHLHFESRIGGQFTTVQLQPVVYQSQLGLPSDVLSQTTIHILIATIAHVAQSLKQWERKGGDGVGSKPAMPT